MFGKLVLILASIQAVEAQNRFLRGSASIGPVSLGPVKPVSVTLGPGNAMVSLKNITESKALVPYSNSNFNQYFVPQHNNTSIFCTNKAYYTPGLDLSFVNKQVVKYYNFTK